MDDSDAPQIHRKAIGKRRKWLPYESPGGTVSEKCAMDGTDFHRRDISTPGGLHHYKDEAARTAKEQSNAEVAARGPREIDMTRLERK